METLAKSDIFFFITSVAVVVITVLLAVLLIFMIRVFKDIKYISQKAKTQSDLISEDINELRGKIKQGFKWPSIFYFFTKLFKKSKTSLKNKP